MHLDPMTHHDDARGRCQRLSRLPAPGPGYRFDPLRRGDTRRDELERYVQAAFAHRHGATVRSFMPTLLGFRDRAGALRGVAGVRGAGEEPLYLEQYLDRPVEQVLAGVALGRAAPVATRHEIAEVGNLAAATRRDAVRMVAHVPDWLLSQRYRWIVFTATSALRQILLGLGAPLVELARADGACVATRDDDWGRYYETDPRVYAGHLPDAGSLAGFVRPDRGD